MATTDDLPYSVAHGLELRAEATKELGWGLALAKKHSKDAEGRMRGALKLAASSLNWLEGSDHEESAHTLLDEMGRTTRTAFPGGCQLTWTGNRHEQACPVAVAHKRIGFSPAIRSRRKDCSICGLDFSECEHLPGQEYAVAGGVGPSGYCPVCMKTECSDHSPDREYEIRPGAIVRDIQAIDEVSIVARPRQPDARLIALPIDTSDLVDFFGPEFEVGMPVHCSRCLQPCEGLDHPFDRWPK